MKKAAILIPHRPPNAGSPQTARTGAGITFRDLSCAKSSRGWMRILHSEHTARKACCAGNQGISRNRHWSALPQLPSFYEALWLCDQESLWQYNEPKLRQTNHHKDWDRQNVKGGESFSRFLLYRKICPQRQPTLRVGAKLAAQYVLRPCCSLEFCLLAAPQRRCFFPLRVFSGSMPSASAIASTVACRSSSWACTGLSAFSTSCATMVW